MTSRDAIRTALTPFAATLKLAYSSVAFKLTAQHFQRDSTLAQCSLNGLRHLARSSTAAPHTTACSLAQPGVPWASTGTFSSSLHTQSAVACRAAPWRPCSALSTRCAPVHTDKRRSPPFVWPCSLSLHNPKSAEHQL
ncbi:hypothetical protein TRVL_07379 [Trypanosoma vivax]|nr:hypothetical protein TRVL_07379 [Trypanosoma vivax]